MSEEITVQHTTVMFMPEQGLAGVKKFSNLTEEEMAAGDGPPEIHYLTDDSWIAMGSPETITVTVVPGDILNTPNEGDSNG